MHRLLILMLTSSPMTALAAPEEEDDDEQKAKATLPADPTGKLYEKFEVHRGFFISSDVGLVWAFSGAERSYSNTQAYVGVNVGYDFTSWFSWQIRAGRGFNANNPYSPDKNAVRDFAWTDVQTGPVVWIKVWDRLAIEVKVLGGVSILDPVPIDPIIDNRVVNVFNPSVGGGVGLKYFTLLTNVVLGFEATFNFMIGANVPVLNVSPLVIRYTF
jgi:hypothetical protein